MSRRECAKTSNRTRICAAAEAIIRGEGMENLTMRRLAAVAGVSLRTPYNLFGSKTDVLIALLDRAELQFTQVISIGAGGRALPHMLDALDAIEAFFTSDEDYYRDIYAAIMASDHQEARNTYVGRATALACMLITQAVVGGELLADTDVEALGRNLAITLLAMLGMWGAGIFSNRESITQVRCVWLAVLLQHCSGTSQSWLARAYAAPPALGG